MVVELQGGDGAAREAEFRRIIQAFEQRVPIVEIQRDAQVFGSAADRHRLQPGRQNTDVQIGCLVVGGVLVRAEDHFSVKDIIAFGGRRPGDHKVQDLVGLDLRPGHGADFHFGAMEEFDLVNGLGIGAAIADGDRVIAGNPDCGY